MGWLRGLLWLVVGLGGMWLALWGLIILSSYVSLALVFVVVFLVIGLIESRRQERLRRMSEDIMGNVETFLRWERVQLMMEQLREGRARARLEELRRRRPPS